MSIKKIKADQREETIESSGAGTKPGNRNWRIGEKDLNLAGH